jgi:hypothetical protein
MQKCIRWTCPTIEVDPFEPEPIKDDPGIAIGIGVAAALIFLVVCGIAVTIQNSKPD